MHSILKKCGKLSIVFHLKESDDVSSNEFLDYGQRGDKFEEVFQEERPGLWTEDIPQENIHEEIQRNYLQLQNKLTEEFQRKLQEWNKMKNSGAKVMLKYLKNL